MFHRSKFLVDGILQIFLNKPGVVWTDMSVLAVVTLRCTLRFVGTFVAASEK